jgi:peptide-methionine (R)-S-oxide reductase
MAMLDRRMLVGGGAVIGLAVGLRWFNDASGKSAVPFEIEKSDSEWRRVLTKPQYEVLRLHRTEIPGSSPLDHETRAGIFDCAACALPLFSSEAKYDSRTGWPSFFRPLDNAVEMSTDYVLVMPRTEVHCRRCGGHLGHRFEDGPRPTGLRYCINGVSLHFRPDTITAG